MVAGLRRLGFNKVFDTQFTADLTILEEGHELIKRMTNSGRTAADDYFLFARVGQVR